MKTTKRLLVAIIFGITTVMMQTEGIAKKQDLEPIVITGNTNSEGNGPRSTFVSITVAYSASQGLIYAQTDNAGTVVKVYINNTVTGAMYNYVMTGTDTARLDFDASVGDWTISFTLDNGDVYYGNFSL